MKAVSMLGWLAAFATGRALHHTGHHRLIFRAHYLGRPDQSILLASRSTCRAIRTSTPVLAGANPARQLKVSHILLKPDEEDLLNQLEQRIQAGESFADLAREYSQCPSKRQGGDLGWISRGRTVPEFEQAAFSAAVGDVVKVRSQFGWHLLTVLREAAEAKVAHLSVQDLAEKLALVAVGDEGNTQFVDVREEGELRLASLPHFQHLPLSRFEEWAPKVQQLLDPGKETVVLCHHGVRSMQMCQFLSGQGFSDLKNVTGGIDAYSRGVDPTVPLY